MRRRLVRALRGGSSRGAGLIGLIKRKEKGMTKKEIFGKIIEVGAEVCNVVVEEIMSGSRKEDVVTARALVVFWANAAGLSVESLLRLTERSNANSINSIKMKLEEMWVERFAFHMLCIEAGKRLLEFAHGIGEDFDIMLPLRKMGKVTGKYRIREEGKVEVY